MQLPAGAVLDMRSRRNEAKASRREPSLEPTKHLEPWPHGSREPSGGRRLSRTSHPVERIRGRTDRLPSGIRGGLLGAAAARHEQHLGAAAACDRSASAAAPTIYFFIWVEHP
jgi:hypothetical protein